MNPDISQLAQELEQDRATLDRELTEIEMLLGQVKVEAERHEGRRAEAEARLAALESEGRAPPGRLGEARAQLMSQTRRATMMQAQVEVLEGKQRALQRYHARVATSLPVLRGALNGTRVGQVTALDSASAEPAASTRGQARARPPIATRGSRGTGGAAPRDRAPDARRPGAEHRQHRPPGPDRPAPFRPQSRRGTR